MQYVIKGLTGLRDSSLVRLLAGRGSGGAGAGVREPRLWQSFVSERGVTQSGLCCRFLLFPFVLLHS